MSWRDYLELPAENAPTLPETWLAKLRLKSWPLRGLLVCLGVYSPLFILTFTNNDEASLTRTWWGYSLLYPTMTLYLLWLIPVFKNLLGETMVAFLPLVPAAEVEDFRLDNRRRREWLAFGLGVVAGWLILPYEVFSGFWQTFYALIGEGLNIGLFSWLAYYVAISTRYLTTLHNQTHGRNIPNPGLMTPLSRWGVAILTAFLGGSLISTLFLPQRDLLSPKNIIIYCILNLLILFVFLRNSESATLLSQFRIFRAFSLFILAAFMGTLGYHYLFGWDTLDGLYMTIITMTTIGYSETYPLDDGGRVFTIILSLASVGIAGYAISAVAAFLFEGDFQRVIIGRKMNQRLASLNDHIILCGAGHIGEQIALEFHKTQTPFLVIDHSQEELETILRLGDIPYLLGDPTKDETLHLAGINRARGLVANLNDDKDNAFVVLSARNLNPQLRIVARLTNEENAEKLRKVGADEIVSPNIIGGLRMASVMIRPSVVTFLDEMMRASGQTLRLEETTLAASSALAGLSLAEADLGQRTGLLIVAIKSRDGTYQFNPQADTALKAGDTLIAIGTPDQLADLRKISGT